MLVDQELDKFLKLKGSGDWFTIKYTPSEEECMEFRKIVFNNLLCMFFFWAKIQVTNLCLVFSKSSTWLHQDSGSVEMLS